MVLYPTTTDHGYERENLFTRAHHILPHYQSNYNSAQNVPTDVSIKRYSVLPKMDKSIGISSPVAVEIPQTVNNATSNAHHPNNVPILATKPKLSKQTRLHSSPNFGMCGKNDFTKTHH